MSERAKEELVDIIDEDDNVLKTVLRREIREKRLLHRVVFVIVLNPDGKLFLQKRAKDKKPFGGLWGIGAGGGVAAGEEYEEAALREVEEELGVKGVELEFLFDFRFKSEENNYKSKVYECVYGGEIKLQEEEIDDGKFEIVEGINKMTEAGLLCPDTKLFFEKYLEFKKREEQAGLR